MDKHMNTIVPTICTRGLVLFPGMESVIDIGRDFSNKALDYASANNSILFVVCQKDVMTEDPTQDDLFSVGTLAEIVSIEDRTTYKRATLRGIQRAELNSLINDGSFYSADVTPLDYDTEVDPLETQALLARLFKCVEEMANQFHMIPKDFVNKITLNITAEDAVQQIEQFFPFDLIVQQEILQCNNTNQKLFIIVRELERAKQYNEIENAINEKVKSSIEESQKEYFLREKVRAIKEELGDVSSTKDDVEKMYELLESDKYPKHVKEKALEELKRYEMLPQASAESSVVRTYLDWLLNVPWKDVTEDVEDLKEVRGVLDEDHYGLEKVKDRIMEYLAVKQMTGNLDSPILCLSGPPGVGKTSLAKSVARALQREFVKMSLGGVKDEAEIRGHRRTYLGALPGRVIQGMKKAKVINPVFLIDEIDKMGADFKGDPSSALLEVLDPEQNKMFSDHYLEEPYDLSQVLFIATANYLENIPAPLQDRLEIIELPSYTEIDKVHIAVEHLIPKQLKANGLKPSQFKLKEKEILFLIRHYTREAGVRQLERVIASLCRKTVLSILNQERKSITINEKLIIEWLGKPKFEYGVKGKKNEIGVVTGLAYTAFGGDVLSVEVNYFEGKGRLVMTGKLGDVMKESAEIALDFVKSNAKDFKIDPEFFDKHDIHIHVPEGAVPKDGPSAGVTMTTAIVSALTETPVYANLAMTGEVTLRGNVLPIGGLREKSLAASRAGITKIIMPKKNVADLDDLPEEVREKIEFIPVEKVEEVLKVALVK